MRHVGGGERGGEIASVEFHNRWLCNPTLARAAVARRGLAGHHHPRGRGEVHAEGRHPRRQRALVTRALQRLVEQGASHRALLVAREVVEAVGGGQQRDRGLRRGPGEPRRQRAAAAGDREPAAVADRDADDVPALVLELALADPGREVVVGHRPAGDLDLARRARCISTPASSIRARRSTITARGRGSRSASTRWRWIAFSRW